MASQGLFSKVDEAAARYPDFVTVVSELLEQYKLPVRTDQAIDALADRVASPGAFRDDLVSMVNVLCFQDESVTSLDLLGLLLVAAAGEPGAKAAATAETQQQPAARILSFVKDALRRRAQQAARLQAMDGDPAVELDGMDPGPAGVEQPAPLPGPDPLPPLPEAVRPASAPPVTSPSASAPSLSGNSPRPEAAAPPPALPVSTGDDPSLASSKSRGSVLARALAISADEVDFGPRPVPEPVRAESATEPASPPLPPSLPLPIVSETGAPSHQRLPRWAGGVAGLLAGLALGLLLAWLWQRRAPVQVPGQDAAVVRPGRAGQAANSAPQEPLSGRRDHEGNGMTEYHAAPHTALAESSTARPVHPPPPLASHSNLRSPGATVGGTAAATPATSTGAGTGTLPATKLNLTRPPEPPRPQPVNLGGGTEAPSAASQRVRLPNVVTGTSGIMAANVLAAPAPAYPSQASAARVQGEVVIEAVVGREGDVVEARVVSGPALLRDAALSAVQHWRYRPYEVDGQPAEIATTARVEFRLSN